MVARVAASAGGRGAGERVRENGTEGRKYAGMVRRIACAGCVRGGTRVGRWRRSMRWVRDEKDRIMRAALGCRWRRTEPCLQRSEPLQEDHRAAAAWASPQGTRGIRFRFRIRLRGRGLARWRRAVGSTAAAGSRDAGGRRIRSAGCAQILAAARAEENGAGTRPRVRLHQPLLVLVGRVAPAEGDAPFCQRDQAMVGNRHAMRVAAQIAERVLGAAERDAWHRPPNRSGTAGAARRRTLQPSGDASSAP